MCGAHATVRGFLAELVARAHEAFDVVVDMEAGLEHLSRGTGRHVSRFVAVVEPYYRSMETARRIAHLAAELGVSDVQAVINKVRSGADRDAVVDFCVANGLPVIGEIPHDASLQDAERAGGAPLDLIPEAASIEAIGRIARTLIDS